MFQPKPIPKLPILVKPIIPVWVFVAAMVAQYAIITIGFPSEPACSINVQEVHKSTYSEEFEDLQEIKLKISTLCNQPQSFTALDGYIKEVLPANRSKVVKVFRNVVKRPSPKMPSYVLIEDLTVPCNGKGVATYLGQANGKVHLKSGKIINISGVSKKPRLVNCRISAN